MSPPPNPEQLAHILMQEECIEQIRRHLTNNVVVTCLNEIGLAALLGIVLPPSHQASPHPVFPYTPYSSSFKVYFFIVVDMALF